MVVCVFVRAWKRFTQMWTGLGLVGGGAERWGAGVETHFQEIS